MWHSARLWLKVIIGFLFSINLLLTSLTYALFGATEKDTVELIVTEATGAENIVVLFAGKFQPLIIHNVFWLSLALIGFFLIFLYFIDHSFKVFLAPGVLCLIMFLFLNLILFVTQSFIFAFTEGAADLFVTTSFSKVRLASWLVFTLGALLIGTSYWARRRDALSQRAGTEDNIEH